MIAGKIVHQKMVLTAGTGSDLPAYADQTGFTVGRFTLIDASETPNQFKTETRKLYKLHVAGQMSSVFNSVTPAVVGTFGPQIADRITVPSKGRIFDVLGVGDSPTDSALTTVLYLAEVNP